MVDRDGVLKSLDGTSSMLFFVAAGLWVAVAVLYGAELFTGRDMEELLGLLTPAGYGVAFVGLLGLYPALADRSPRPARVGAVFVAIGVVGGTVLVAAHLGQIAGIVTAQPEWVTAFNLPLLAGVVLGFGTFGIVGLRTGVLSRNLGLLLLWPAAAHGTVILGLVVSGQSYPHWVHVGHSSTEALAMLAIGYVLRTGTPPTDRAETAVDSTA